MSLDQPRLIIGIPERQQCVAQILDRSEVLDPQQILLEDTDSALGASIPLRAAHEGGRTRDAQEREFCWKASAMYWLPWSCRTLRPEAISAAKPPKRCRTPWRIGSSASKRVARRAAWMPTHSAER